MIKTKGLMIKAQILLLTEELRTPIAQAGAADQTPGHTLRV